MTYTRCRTCGQKAAGTDSYVEALEEENKKLRDGLKIYARRYREGKCWNWIEGGDSYGVTCEFDYEGDEQDEPWEIAEKLLAKGE